MIIMIFIRSLLYFISFLFTTIYYATRLGFTGTATPFENRCRFANSWGTTNLRLLKFFCRLDYQIEGFENIFKGNCIVMSKHQSTWETISLRGLLPPEQSWVLKRELLSVPIFGWALKKCEPIAIDRNAGRKAVRQVIEKGTEALEKGRWVIIFPEGTRVEPGERKKYAIGGAMLAERSGFPVVPIAHNAGQFWKRRDLKKYPGIIKVVVGDPITSSGKKASEINKEVEYWIEMQMEKIQHKDVF